MRIQISACTDKTFLAGLMPMAYLTDGSAQAVNDNAVRQHGRWRARMHMKRAAGTAHHALP